MAGQAVKQGFGWATGCLLFVIVAVVALAVIGGLGKASTATNPPALSTLTPTIAPPSLTGSAQAQSPSTAQTPIAIKGSGSQKTKPFALAGGDYTVTISGNCKSNVIADLYIRGGTSASDNLFNEIADGHYTYTTQEYGLVAGQYYLDVSDENAWTVTFTPLG